MGSDESTPQGPDLTLGVAENVLADGQALAGRVGHDAVVLVRSNDAFHAVDATCTHYGGPLVEGIVVDDTIRCPWHHACFSLRTGEALRAPALAPLACWTIERRDGKVYVRAKEARERKRRSPSTTDAPKRIVIVGGGAAGFAAAEMLRREGYDGSITMLSSDAAPPVDRPNLSKDYLAGTAPDEWIPLRDDRFYADQSIDLRLERTVAAIDTRAHEVVTADGSRIAYDRLLLATGAEPVRLSLPGIDSPHVHTLRTLADSRSIIADAARARVAVVMGASFIGLEVAASLRARDIEVHVVAPDKRPMERVLGSQLGDFVRSLHEAHGVIFHLEDTAKAIDGEQVTLASGAVLRADLVVVGVGVRPRLALAQDAGLAIDRGVVVNEYLETSARDLYAAGDIARWPDPHTRSAIRVEHWVVAERQGQFAALNMLGVHERFDAVPFFWSQHYDVAINYVGHAEGWDDIVVDGDVAQRDGSVRYRRGDRVLAVASIGRDRENLLAELAMERALA
jgi:NADPH-dependent 2,4-dienoyl-CoA reductase/sulfur reductase-like enzyme/nitrite reductase/ring-hydroxylating ferredoxin subunit